jgi:pantetheine-phosphate adenylyltransferase
MIAIYPGSFDPITLGHLDLIKRSSILFEKVIVAVLKNPQKQTLFTVEKRVQQIRECTKNIENVEVDSFSGLTVEYAKIKQAGVLLRGLRVMSDFEQELQMAHINKTLEYRIETIFLATNTELSFISSSVVKEIAKFGGAIDHLVTSNIASDLYSIISK